MAGDALQRDLRRMMVLAPLVSLAAAALFVLVIGATAFRERWLQPVLLMLPLACFILLEARLDRRRQVALASIGLVLALVAMAALWVRYSFPDIAAKPPYTAAPFDVLADRIGEAGFSRGTIIGSRAYVSGNLAFRLPEARTLTPEYSRLPIAYPPPFLVVWPAEFVRQAGDVLDVTFRLVCGAPLPPALETISLGAPYWRSDAHTFTLHAAIVERCPADGDAP